MAQVIFISEQYLKDTSYIDENVDVKLLRNSILETQEMRIRSVIGTGLYDELKTQVTAGTKTALNNTLLSDYIAPALKYWVLHDAALILTFKVMNKSIVKRSSENTEVIQATDLDKLMDFFKNRAEYFSERITKYLLENENSYPLFTDAGSGVDTEHPKHNNYTQGLFLGTSKNHKGIDIDFGRLNNC
jgi:phage anti-repressor protein